jgi:hypothetical protein
VSALRALGSAAALLATGLVMGCVTDDGARGSTGPVALEGLVRRTAARCGPREGFRLAVANAPVVGRRFSLRAGGRVDGQEAATFVTTDEGAFRVSLPPGTFCVVDTTSPEGPEACEAQLTVDPEREPVPIIVLKPEPCVGQ